MKCKDIQAVINDYIDSELSEDEKVKVETHLKTCTECKSYYTQTLEIVENLAKVEKIEPQKDLTGQIIFKLKKERRRKRVRKFLSYAAVFILGIFLTATIMNFPFSFETEQSYQENSLAGRADIAMDSAVVGEREVIDKSYVDAPMGSYFDKEKIVYSASINLNVTNARETLEKIVEYSESIGGFVESSSSNSGGYEGSDLYRSSYITIRVPREKFNEAVTSIKDFGEETSTDIQSTNISAPYYDLEDELNSLKLQEEKLMDYLGKAEKMEDLLTVESELSRIRTEINRLKTQLDNLDRQIDYSTITVFLREENIMGTTVKSPFNDMAEKIKKAFISSINIMLQSIEFLVLFVFRLIPFLVILLPVAFFIKEKIRKRKK